MKVATKKKKRVKLSNLLLEYVNEGGKKCKGTLADGNGSFCAVGAIGIQSGLFQLEKEGQPDYLTHLGSHQTTDVEQEILAIVLDKDPCEVAGLTIQFNRNKKPLTEFLVQANDGGLVKGKKSRTWSLREIATKLEKAGY
jgi:hypothetical protein